VSFPPVGARNTTGHFFAKRVSLHGLHFNRNYPARARGCSKFYGSVVCRHGHAPIRVLYSGSGRHGQITKQGHNTPVVVGANPAGPAISKNRRGVEFHSSMLVPAAWEKHDSRIAPMGVADHHRNACMVVGCVQPAMQDNFPSPTTHPATFPACGLPSRALEGREPGYSHAGSSGLCVSTLTGGWEPILSWCNRACPVLGRMVRVGMARRQATLSTPQCSNGTTQSRPFPARAVKIMESAGHITKTCCAAQQEQTYRSSVRGPVHMPHLISLRHPITIPAFPVTPESSSPALGIAVAQTALPSVRTHPSSRSGYVAQSALSSGSRTPPSCNAHDEAQ